MIPQIQAGMIGVVSTIWVNTDIWVNSYRQISSRCVYSSFILVHHICNSKHLIVCRMRVKYQL